MDAKMSGFGQLSNASMSVEQVFSSRFGGLPQTTASAPGRINLIGEHVDYNRGLVLPFAIAQRTSVAGRMRPDLRVSVWSDWTNERVDWDDIRQLDPSRSAPGWSRYVAGAVAQFVRRGNLHHGLDLAIDTSIPVGAGLSSSASLTAAITTLLRDMTSCELDGWEAARWCQATEHEFAGVPCGLMDPLVSLLGRAGKLLKIDFDDQSLEWIPLELGDCRLVAIHSGVQHTLAGGEYAQRRNECQAAARELRVSSLREIEVERLPQLAPLLPDILYSRVRHVVTEIDRVRQAESCCRQHDWERLGKLLTVSHQSLADLYEVSCYEIDQLVELLLEEAEVLGARMTGGGFGGCVIALL
ncbi:MAG TPA: galactokinase, partial [Pirellulaceae bacterium]|nr:galactokinase [Pirellulaceae bacterium]